MSHANHAYLPAAGLDLLLQEGSHGHNPLARWLHSRKRMQDNNREQILNWMREAALLDPRVVDSDQPIFGKIVYLAAWTGGESPAS
jgi:hypothetical protein